jgi:ketosteroid isomerase-like protein
MMDDDSATKQDIWNFIQEMNRVWAANGNPDDLDGYFHENMVAITPTDRERRQGRAACVAGWKAFVDAAKIKEWQVTDPDIVVYGDGQFAVVTYYWDMSYTMNDQKTIHSSGRDMFVVVKEKGRWWAVADQFSPYPG